MIHFASKQEFIEYLRLTLIPDLVSSGRKATAEDFLEAIHWMNVEETKPTEPENSKDWPFHGKPAATVEGGNIDTQG